MASRRFSEQLEAIKTVLHTPIAAGPAGTGPDDPPCGFRRGMIVVSQEDADWLCNSNDSPLRELRARQEDPAGRSGLVRVRVGAATDEELLDVGVMEPDADVRAALGRLREIADRRAISASPNHVIGIANGTVCPADEPWPSMDPPSVHRVTPASPAHRRPRVLVIDTGLVEGYETLELGDGVGGGRRDQETEVDQDGNPTDFIREYVGHGTYITGLLKAVAPTADVYVSNAVPKPGALFEDEFGDSLFTAITQFQATLSPDAQDAWPDIISLSAGTTLYYDPQRPLSSPDHGLRALRTFMETLNEKPTLLVAAAGNNGSSVRFHPAALAELNEFSEAVVSVGALRENPGDGRACFSDFGPWVSVYAPGERLVAGFLEAPLKYQHSTFGVCQFLRHSPPDCTCQNPAHTGELTEPGHGDIAHFTGRARWSGTSFATPLVAGMIARGTVHDGGAGVRAAAESVLKNATQVTVEGAPVLAVFPENYTGRRPSA